MLRLYCEDISVRIHYQHYFRDRGVPVEAPSPAEFISACGKADTKAILIIGHCPPQISVQLRYELPVFSVGGQPVANSIEYNSAENPVLMQSVLHLTGNIGRYNYRDTLISDDDGMFYLGYTFALTKTEQAIVAYLVYKADLEVSTDEILSVCVGDAHRHRSNVKQNISNINKKSRIAGGRSLIGACTNGMYRINRYI